ncbi:MAG: MBL fold metallo-hydrolase, partial [Clostridia bacterium]|nr:MBL fold metallo-hydrolase [Clostridia bacterium]
MLFKNQHRTDMTVVPLGDGIYRLTEYDLANAFVVVGDDRACLIDCCAGVCELDAVVRLITDKPVEVLVTHAHADHIGGASWFPTARLH